MPLSNPFWHSTIHAEGFQLPVICRCRWIRENAIIFNVAENQNEWVKLRLKCIRLTHFFLLNHRPSKRIAPGELSYAFGYIRHTSISHYINNKERPNRPTATWINIWKIRFKSRPKNQFTGQDMLMLNQWYEMWIYTRKNEFTKHINFETYKHAYILKKEATKLQISIHHTKSLLEQQSKVDLNRPFLGLFLLSIRWASLQ